MNCVNCRVRSKKYVKYLYCLAKKSVIDFGDCYCCKYKIYKNASGIKGKKHKRTVATSIPKSVKVRVWNRDNGRCVCCGKAVGVECANAHFISRSAGGLGVEENIFTACLECHHEQDNGLNIKLYDENVKAYLRSIYGKNWTIQNLTYKKSDFV